MHAKHKFDYKWVILAVCFGMIFICLGFCSSNKGIYLDAITEAVGIPRGLFSINDSCRYITMAVINLFFGTLLSRFGIRVMVAFGFLATIASTVIYALATDIVTFCIGGALLGMGLAFTTTNMASIIIRRWFHKDIGKYTGIVFAANGIGATVATVIASPLINESGNPFGYRKSYWLIAAVLIAAGILSVLLLKDPASPVTTTKETKKTTVEWAGIPFEHVKKQWFFYVTGAVVFISGFTLQGLAGAFAAHLGDVNISSTFITLVVSVYSITLTVSKVLTGWLYDKKGLLVVMTACQISAVLAFLALAFANKNPLGLFLAVTFAVLYSVALPLETLLIPLLVNDFFGSLSYDKILGIYAAVNYAGYALGAPIINWCYDVCGTYLPAFFIFAFLMALVIVVFQIARRSAVRLKISYEKENSYV